MQSAHGVITAMHKPSIKTITVKKLILFFLTASVLMFTIIVLSFRSVAQKMIEDKALALSEVVMAGLTAHMKAGIMDKSASFLDEIRQLKEVSQVTVVRAPELNNQYGAGMAGEKSEDPFMQKVFKGKYPVFVMTDFTVNPNIRAVVPYIATSNGAIDCLNCHDVAEGTVLGVVDIGLNLTEYRNRSLRAVLWIVSLSVLFITLLVGNIFQTIQTFVKQPLDALVKNAKRAFLQHEPVDLQQFKSAEFHNVANEFNQFNREIISNQVLLEQKNEALLQMNTEIEATLKETVFTMGLIEEYRSKETKNHTRRVAEYSRFLASMMRLPENQVELIATAAPLHDIGKMGISDAILLKAEKLTPEERMMMRSHPEIGFTMLRHSSHDILKAATIIAHQHHERWDGSGYPKGLKGDEIHIYGRIVSLADVLDALFSERPYKHAWPLESVTAFIKRERGKMFDPAVVDVFFSHVDGFIKIHQHYHEH